MRYQIANIYWIIEKAREFQKNIYFCFMDYAKILFVVWITTNCGKFWKRWEYQTNLPASWEICMQAKKQQSEPDMEQLTGPMHSTFERLVVQRVVGHCHGEELGPFCWPVLTAGIAVCRHPIKLLSVFLRCNGFARIQKSVVNQISSRSLNSDYDPFTWCKFGSGKSFGASSQSNHWTGKSCTFHHTSQSDWEMVGLCFIEFT